MTYKKILDDRCISIFIKYIPLFQNKAISLDLIKQQFYRKGNKEWSNFLKKWYYELNESNSLTDMIENILDNAFVKIQDKDKVPFYLKLISNPNKFPFVMEMLGQWNINEAKPIIKNRLEKDKIKTSAIRSLGYYKDKETIPLIEKYLKSEFQGVREEAKKVIDRLNQ